MSESSRLGIRNSESKEFLKFFDIVEAEAKKHESVFIIESGEGNQEFFDGMEAEDLSGWLVPTHLLDKIMPLYEASQDNAIDEAFPELATFAIWEKSEGGVTIQFQKALDLFDWTEPGIKLY
ncbi:MAG: hypothetical protein FWD27_04315 [Coriobacteriia bacterium]|nr:hypothetical protein [Coriobacteriia bacterium]